MLTIDVRLFFIIHLNLVNKFIKNCFWSKTFISCLAFNWKTQLIYTLDGYWITIGICNQMLSNILLLLGLHRHNDKIVDIIK